MLHSFVLAAFGLLGMVASVAIKTEPLSYEKRGNGTDFRYVAYWSVYVCGWDGLTIDGLTRRMCRQALNSLGSLIWY
jgi:hypothetical protein